MDSTSNLHNIVAGTNRTLTHAHTQMAMSRGRSLRHLPSVRQDATAVGESSDDGAFLKIFPLEIRNMIYKNLLSNEILSDLASIPMFSYSSNGSVTRVNYNLSPAILRTCRQIYHEASGVLYGDNTFIFDLYRSTVWFSPLNRHNVPAGTVDGRRLTRVEYKAYSDELALHPLLPKIKHWKIVVGTAGHYEEAVPPCQQIYELYKVLRNLKPQTLKVVVAPLYKQRITATLSLRCQNPILRAILRPFRYLRNIEGFELIEGSVSSCIQSPASTITLGIPGNATLRYEPYGPHESFRQSKEELELLIRGNQPVSCLLKMYENIVRYARAFERHPTFKFEMGPGYDEVMQRVRLIQGGVNGPVPRLIPTDIEVLKQPAFKIRGHTDFSWVRYPGNKNPFKNNVCHPVEAALEEASYAWENNNIEMLKEARRIVVEFLEVQYQRIVAASFEFNELIKHLKLPRKLLDPARSRFLANSYEFDTIYERALLALSVERYAQSFQRDVPKSMELDFYLGRRKFRYAYSQLPRELLITKLNDMYENGASYLCVIDTFKKVADDMDAQYLEIRNSRKALFNADDSDDFGVDVDLEPNRCDEMVDWTIPEPVITCKERPVHDPALTLAPLGLPPNFPTWYNANLNLFNAKLTYNGSSAPANVVPPNGPNGQHGHASGPISLLSASSVPGNGPNGQHGNTLGPVSLPSANGFPPNSLTGQNGQHGNAPGSMSLVSANTVPPNGLTGQNGQHENAPGSISFIPPTNVAHHPNPNNTQNSNLASTPIGNLLPTSGSPGSLPPPAPPAAIPHLPKLPASAPAASSSTSTSAQLRSSSTATPSSSSSGASATIEDTAGDADGAGTTSSRGSGAVSGLDDSFV